MTMVKIFTVICFKADIRNLCELNFKKKEDEKEKINRIEKLLILIIKSNLCCNNPRTSFSNVCNLVNQLNPSP